MRAGIHEGSEHGICKASRLSNPPANKAERGQPL